MNLQRKIIYSCLVFVLCFFAVQTHAQIYINEIAWQGYLGDANNEWIELYNAGSTSVNLDGWLVEADDGTPSINLSGLTINSNSFLLLERTDDDSVPGIAGDIFYTGALANTGELLNLKNSDGVVQHSASFFSGWPEVSDVNQTLSFINNSWTSSVATPKNVNEGIDIDDEVSDDENEDETDSEDDSVNGEGGSKPKEETRYDTRKITIESSNHAYVGVPLVFNSLGRDHDGSKLRKGIYIWNMGDGNVLYRNSNEEFSYTYNHPGEYVVVLYYNNVSFGKKFEDLEPEAQDEHVLNVLEHAISIEKVLPNGTITLKNNSPHTIDLDGWKLISGEVEFIVPRRTLVRAGKSITLSNLNTGIAHNPISVFNPTGQFVDIGSFDPNIGFLDTVKSSSSVVTPSTEIVDDVELLSEEEVMEIESSFADVQNESSVSSTHNSNTITILFFVALLGLSAFLVWYLVTDKKKNIIVEGYEIVED